MSHFDRESSAAGFPADVVVPWAARATGINATKASARTRLTDFETRTYMRFSSAIKLTEQIVGAVSSTDSGSG
jgi:hypothetical protein